LTAGDDPVAAAVTQFLKTGPSKERFLEYLTVDLFEQFPKSCSKYVLLGALLSDLDKTAQLAWVVDFVNRRIEAAGFGNHPEDYYWRPIVEGALTFRDVTDGTADLVDIVSANDSLDRRQARQAAAAREVPKPTTKEVKARTIAALMLETQPRYRRRGGLAQAAREIAEIVGLTAGGTENAIRDLWHT
jgi:hypothetical protein